MCPLYHLLRIRPYKMNIKKINSTNHYHHLGTCQIGQFVSYLHPAKVLWWFDYGDKSDVRCLQPLRLLLDLSHERRRRSLNILLVQVHLSSQNSCWRFLELSRKQIEFPTHRSHTSSSTADTPRVSMSVRKVVSANLASWDFGMQVRFDTRVNLSYSEWSMRIGIWMRGRSSRFLVVIYKFILMVFGD